MTVRQAFRDDERAVSPVIGVILMVAITVILAAVIGTFVLNLGGSVQTNVQAGASVSATSGGGVKVTWTSNQNAGELNVQVNGCTSGTTTLNNVGDTATLGSGCSTGDSATVVVTAFAEQGDAKTVIINKDVKF